MSCLPIDLGRVDEAAVVVDRAPMSKLMFTAIAHFICGREPAGLAAAAVIDAVPAPLRRALPAAWQTFMQEVGGEEELLSAFQRFRMPAELELVDGHVVFLEENQGGVLWAFRLGDADADDPDVVQFVVTDEGLDGPFSEETSLTSFLLAILIMQGTHGDGLLPHVGYVERGLGTAAILEATGLRVVAEAGTLTALLGDDAVATIVADDDGETVIVATANEAAFHRFAAALEIDADVFEL